MEAKPADYPDYKTQPSSPATDYRVTLWEQPEVEGIEAGHVGWGEMTFDLVGARDVREAIAWAEQRVGVGPYSRSGRPVHDREYVLYARVPESELWLQIAGWDPSRNPHSDNLPRLG